jgi:PAS domain S-box-containing protein
VKRENGTDRVRLSIEGSETWLWYVGGGRVVVLFLVATGAYALPGQGSEPLLPYLTVFYLFGFASCVGYLVKLRWSHPEATPLLTWTQVLVDFCVVAATVGFTKGPLSFFAFLFVVVILEGGMLLGFAQAFVFATLAAAFMLVQMLMAFADYSGADARLNLLTNLLVQVLAFYLTAFISTYWAQRLRRMQRFQREILDNMNSGFIITDALGVVRLVNRAALRILGVSEPDVHGEPVASVLVSAEEGECPVMTALRTRRDFTSYEFKARTGGGTRQFGLTTSCVFSPGGQVTGVIASFTDLTELARMREELQRQDRLAAVGELSAGLAHEIRNPVASIRGAVDELQRSLGNPALVGRLACIATRECDHLNHIISEFLDFARESRAEREPFDLGALVEEVAGLLRQSFPGEPGPRVETSGGGPCPVRGDRSQLKQVLVNIGKNGMEAMDGGGTLRFSLVRDAVSVGVRIEDEGPGIPPDKVARIFEPFYTTRESGVGMGLAVCMRLVTAHDGTIQVASRPGGGTAMTVRLPAARTEEGVEH